MQITYRIVTTLILTGLFIISPAGAESINQSVHPDKPSLIENGFIKGEGEIHLTGLIRFLQEIGMDISYGEDGETIFSMVDKSLTRIISDLASGNADGFLSVPLIQETFKHLGMNPEEIIVNPEDVPDTFEALDQYHRKYQENLNYT